MKKHLIITIITCLAYIAIVFVKHYFIPPISCAEQTTTLMIAIELTLRLLPVLFLVIAAIGIFKSSLTKGKKVISVVVLVITMLACMVYYQISYTMNDATRLAKPVIYLYPKQETKVQVTLVNKDKLTCTYPVYQDGWNIVAKPNGDLIDSVTGRYYYCLYWEGKLERRAPGSKGFVVSGKDTISFLEEKLAILGLNEREANEFIIYWLPKMEVNAYNYIYFQTEEEINSYMPLNILPKPDSTIRVVMEWKGLKEKIEVQEQILRSPKRQGFVAVEWGGIEQ